MTDGMRHPADVRLLAGRYRVEGSLGRGGMSEVFYGYDERLDRRVAIKLLRPPAPGTVPAAPDSPESAEILDALDRDRKRAIYARAGIREYWIVNLADRCLEVYRDPVAAPGQASSYRSSQKLTPSDSIAPLAATTATVTVADLLP